ncbi:MAG: cytochrome c [Gemmatimonadales bacterium]
MFKVAAAAAAAVSAGFVAMGGWAVVTVKDVPAYFVAGQRYTVEFQVRQHGRTLLSDLDPHLVVSTSSPRMGGPGGGADAQQISAKRRGGAGTYAATFTAPETTELYLVINSGFGTSNLRLYPIPVLSPGAAPLAVAPEARGRALFVAKGCNVCHANADLTDRPDNQQIAVGPDLGGRRLARALVMQRVKNPNSQVMPDLQLSDAEVEALAAFLSPQVLQSSSRPD